MAATTRSWSWSWSWLKLLICLASFLLNALLLSYLYMIISHQSDGLQWSRKAAEEAEAAAAVACSGHGQIYLDSPLVAGRLVCECNTCYGGNDCSVRLPDCPADAASGDPLFLEPYWREHAATSSVVISGWHRMGYSATGDNYISVELERQIRLLHRAVGNAVTEGRFILFGAGSSQLINAAVLALSPDNTDSSSSPASVVAAAPYYPMYKQQISYFDRKEYEWKGAIIMSNSVLVNNQSAATNIIEFVTSPTNPEGRMSRSVIRGSKAIHDHAYYWPHFSAIQTPADEDLMLFTISKFSGHASSRFGWAVIKDEKVYKKMAMYLDMSTIGVSRDTQLRMLQILKTMVTNSGGRGSEGDIFRFGYKTQAERWSKLNKVVSSSNGRFSLQELSPQYCNYFKKIKHPSPAYAWLKCEAEEDRDCAAALKELGIISQSGTFFEAESSYARLSLIKRQDDFDQLMQRFEALVSKDDTAFFHMMNRMYRQII